MGPEAIIFVFWMLSFKPGFSLSCFIFIKRLFSSSLLSAIRVVSSSNMRLLVFLLAILIPACASFRPAFLMIYSAYKLNKQGDNIQPWITLFPIWNQPIVPFPVQTVPSWPAYRFLRRQVRWSGISISLRIFQFVVIHTFKGFSIVNRVHNNQKLQNSSCLEWIQLLRTLNYSFITLLHNALIMTISRCVHPNNQTCFINWIIRSEIGRTLVARRERTVRVGFVCFNVTHCAHVRKSWKSVDVRTVYCVMLMHFYFTS